MSKLNERLTLVANLSVVAGVVFLAAELRQNNELLDAEARFNRTAQAAESITLMAENPDLAGYLLRANNDEELAPAEALRLQFYMRRTFTIMEWAYREVPEELLPVATWRRLFAEPYRRATWEELKGEYDPGLVELFETQVFTP